MKFLVVQTAFLGDVILTTALLRDLHNRYKDSQIDVITTPAGAHLLEGLPGVRAIPLDKKRMGLFKTIAYARSVLASQDVYDAVYCVHRSLRSLMVARYSIQSGRRYAYTSFFSRLLGFETTPYPNYSESIHYADKVLALAALGTGSRYSSDDRRPWLIADTAKDDYFLSAFGLKRRAYCVISPYSVWGTKMWPTDRYVEVAKRLSSASLKVVVTGESNPIGSSFSELGPNVVDLVSKTSIQDLKAVIAGAACVISNDSAAVHLASAFNVPTVAIFGPTIEKFGFFPLAQKNRVLGVQGLSCRPCHIHGPQTCPQKHFRCMLEISTEQVVQAVRELL